MKATIVLKIFTCSLFAATKTVTLSAKKSSKALRFRAPQVGLRPVRTINKIKFSATHGIGSLFSITVELFAILDITYLTICDSVIHMIHIMYVNVISRIAIKGQIYGLTISIYSIEREMWSYLICLKITDSVIVHANSASY